MKYQLLAVVMFVITLCCSSSEAAVALVPWREGEGGTISWAEDCDFFGNDMGKVENLSARDCGKSCLAKNQCTNFTWNKATCHLKTINTSRADTEINPTEHRGAVCGFVRSRIPQPIPDYFQLFSPGIMSKKF